MVTLHMLSVVDGHPHTIIRNFSWHNDGNASCNASCNASPSGALPSEMHSENDPLFGDFAGNPASVTENALHVTEIQKMRYPTK